MLMDYQVTKLGEPPRPPRGIQMLTPLDILTFYICDLFLRRILMILQFFIQFDNMY
jgi:hypothetical protein